MKMCQRNVILSMWEIEFCFYFILIAPSCIIWDEKLLHADQIFLNQKVMYFKNKINARY